MTLNLTLPIIIASSVIRSTQQGESHGGVYLVDLEKSTHQQVINWNDGSIDWSGRGADRGLRGIAFYRGNILLAASDEIFEYDQNFQIVNSYKNPYLKHCHEIYLDGENLWLTSTGFDSILEFHLPSRKFVRGYSFRYGILGNQIQRFNLPFKPVLKVFDPNAELGPAFGDTLHINNVFCLEGRIFISGTNFGYIFTVKENRVGIFAIIPRKTHNAKPFKNGVLLNNTNADSIQYRNRYGKIISTFEIVHFSESELLMGSVPKDHARQGFARGLCFFGDDIIIGGSSPGTISVYLLGRASSQAIKTVNITMDVRNAIHGLEIWPY